MKSFLVRHFQSTERDEGVAALSAGASVSHSLVYSILPRHQGCGWLAVVCSEPPMLFVRLPCSCIAVCCQPGDETQWSETVCEQ